MTIKQRIEKVLELLNTQSEVLDFGSGWEENQEMIQLLSEVRDNPLKGEWVFLLTETQEVDMFEETKYNLNVFATEEEVEAQIKEYKEVDGYEHEYDIEAFEIKGDE